MDELQHWLSDWALVLIAGHHKVEDDDRSKDKEANNRHQGEPVHLPKKKKVSQVISSEIILLKNPENKGKWRNAKVIDSDPRKLQAHSL